MAKNSTSIWLLGANHILQMSPQNIVPNVSRRNFVRSITATSLFFAVPGAFAELIRTPAQTDTTARPSLVKVTVGGIGVTQGFEIEQQPVSGVQLLVAYGTGIISGAVTMQGGTLTDYRTEIICRREGSRTGVSGAFLDARGHFTMKGLAPGSYDCGVQFVPVGPSQGRPVARPPQAPHQTITVSNGVETELTFLVDLTPKGVVP